VERGTVSGSRGRAARRWQFTLGSVLVLALASTGSGVAGAGDQSAAADGGADCGVPVLAVEAITIAPAPAPGSAEEQAELDLVHARQSLRGDPADTLTWHGREAVATWNDRLLAIVRDLRLNPIRAARALALLNVGLHDARVTACAAAAGSPSVSPAERDPRIQPVAPADGPAHPSLDVAFASVAAAVLIDQYPGWEDRIATWHAQALSAAIESGLTLPSGIAAGEAVGEAVGRAVLAHARADGSDAVWRGTAPVGEGLWRHPPSGLGPPVEPLAGTWKPWILPTGDALRPGPPPPYGSPEWQRDADEVVAVTRALTDEQVRIARSWADGTGSDTPPGHWTRIAIELARDHGLDARATATMLAWMTMAQADAFIACWDAKYAYWTGRPITLIPGFASTILTPPFPAFPSGHSVQSAAAAAVLAHALPAEAERVLAMAEEAGMSRLYGGIHYRVDIEVGQEIGLELGRRAAERMGMAVATR
jgi:membrane-associated phospholipid phosphatase